MRKLHILFAAGLLLCAFSLRLTAQAQIPQGQKLNGRELFYSDSLNALAIYRTYPVPKDVKYAPAPEGYEPVYISSYARHGSRKLVTYDDLPARVFENADTLGHLTPLGKEVWNKILLMRDDMQLSYGDLTSKGVQQHKGIAERMYRNYPNIFSRKGTPVRLYSTNTQRTMFSMFAENEQLLQLNPNINSTRQASTALTYLRGEFDRSKDNGYVRRNVIAEYFDAKPVLDRLFTGEVPALKDTAQFIKILNLYSRIIPGMDLEDADYIWDLFTLDELFILQQAISYSMYTDASNSPHVGDLALPAVRPLLKDFLDKADTALQEDIPGADLRFGHDSYLTPLVALIGVNGYVERVEDPLKVIDTYQDFWTSPMAGNLQMVFFRNESGDVLVKFLHNEIESWIPIETDLYPYYHWNDVREYFISLIEE